METGDTPSILRQENGQSISNLCQTTPHDNDFLEQVAKMEADRENNLRVATRCRETGSGLGAEDADDAWLFAAKEIPCNECTSSFSSLQKYMEHHCMGSSVSDLEDDGVENLTGEIIYQADGSAFIIEDSGESSQCGPAGAKGLFSPVALQNFRTAGRDRAQQPSGGPVAIFPQVINTFHIAMSLGKHLVADQAFPNTSAFAGPVLHSFRVYDLRHKSNKDYLIGDGAAKNCCFSKDVPNNVDLSEFDGCISDGKRKPVLMCFLCKLSFGYVKSFVSHAVHDHRMTLNKGEQKLLAFKYVSAIIQGIGKDKEPLLSFLEPKKLNLVVPHFSAADLIDPSSGFSGLWKTFHVENGNSLQACLAFLRRSGSPAVVADPPLRNAEISKAEVNLGDLASSTTEPPSSSRAHFSLLSGSNGLEQDSSTLHSNGTFHIKSEPQELGGGDKDEGAYSNELDDNEEIGDLEGSTTSRDFPLLNQSISPLSTSVLKYSEKGTSSPFLTVSDDLERSKELFVAGDSSNDNSNHSRSDRDCFDLTKVQGGSPCSHSNHLIQRVDENPNPPRQHAATPGNPGAGSNFPGSGVECPKCDTVLGSSLGGHMTMMHSRNSCKTLKCPKCNWHYKYQQTLDTHMKEKHPESGGSCSYCGTGRPHPRLARGESYTCGYKPFCCEVCNYSTTTKGNLSIHMQSDKHLNNVQSLQNGGTDAALSRSTPPTPASSTPSPPSRPLKQRPAWCCEVCDYETGVARNLRIHMTSEKHMHNVVMLQQNAKQIQHSLGLGLSLGLASTEADFYQYYLAQNLGLTSVKLENSADRQMRISPFQLDPSMGAGVAPCLVNNELSRETCLVGNPLMGNNVSTLDKHPSPCHNDPQLKLFQCAVCSHFTTDSLEALVNHAMAERLLPEEEWHASVGGDLHQCQLCSYSTQVRANFQLHCETEKHLQRYRLAAHIRETGGPGCWKMKSTAIADPMQLRCIACGYHGNSVEKLRLHATRPQHEAAVRIYKHLQKQERAPNWGSYNYHCVVCNYSTGVRLELLQHVFSSRHQQADGLRRLRAQHQGGTSDGDELSELFLVKDCLSKVSKEPDEMDSIVGEHTKPLALRAAVSRDFNDKSSQEAKKTEKEFRPYTAAKEHPGAESKKGLPLQEKENDAAQNTATFGKKKTISSGQTCQCPYCNFSSKDPNRLQMHISSQHSLQPVVRCPLCQDVLSNKIHLHLHLTHLHSVASDCVEKLLLTVFGADVAMPNKIKPVSDKDKLMETSDIIPDGSGKSIGDCISDENKNTTQDNTKYKESFQKEEEMLWKDGLGSEECDKASAKGQTSPDPFTKPLGLLQKQHSVHISDHQMPKHCCNLCGQVFNTVQKLQIHSQCHTNQTCNLCQIIFPSLPILRKHLEISHSELSEADIRQLCRSPAINGDVYSESDTKAFDKTPAHQHQLDKGEEQYQEGKVSPTGSGGSSLLEEMGSEPKRTLPHRKGPNFYMEKFLDPTRPYKCSVCKESFTQKNILLVHYNSVSHLHKLKKVLHEALSPVPPEANSSIDNKPYKCNICNVAYSQSSTLEIHMRSVLHQTKTRTAKIESNSRAVNGNSVTPPSPHHSLPPPSPVPVGHGSIDSSLPVSTNNEMKIEAKEVIRNKSMEKAPVQSTRSPVQVHVPVQHELQQQAAFFQHQFLNSAFWAHFPMTPETLLQFQQPQFLFPFYIPNTEFSLGPEVALNSTALGIPGITGTLQQDLKQQLQQQLQMSQQKLQQQETHTQPQQQKTQQPTCNPKVDDNKSVSSEILQCKNTEEKLEANDRKQDSQNNNDVVVDSKAIKKQKLSEPLNPPPRIVLGANGNAAKALLENFGFELVIQYNENRQKNQKKNRIREEETHNKYECRMCGKLFSNLLILKIHQEHVHGQLFPNGELEKFAQQYREAYDKLYPVDSPSPEASSPPPPLPSQPLQPPSQAALTAVKTVQTPPAQAPQSLPPPPPPPLPPAKAPSQLPSLDLHLLPPLMMPHSGLPPQLALQLPSLDSLSQAQVSQLCQQQLADPDFLMQLQFKRPRTRITDEQLKVLRTYFDINNSPNEEQIQEMAEKSGLQQKVIKHWFRNTLFKERQRNKDSAYNFNIPPVTTLEDFRLEPQFSALEYYKTDGTVNKRSSRTRFTDYQLRVLQDFFDTNAYPKDDEIEQLSTALNLPTRVIVVWFQNARQKARRTYENQTDAKDSEREKTNERYIRTSSMQYQCKKCTVVFPRIFDLISHQKKQCYKDEDDDGKDNGQTEFMDTGEQNTHKASAPADSFKTPITTATNSGSSSPVMPSPQSGIGKTSPKPDLMTENPKQANTVSSQGSDFLPETRPSQTSIPQYQQQVTTQQQVGRPQSQPPSNAITSRPLAVSSLKNSLPLQIFQFQCDQCKITLPSVELWQEHQHMHFLATQNQFFHTQFLERASEMPYMIFDPNNPLMKGQLLSGTFSQMAAQNNLALISCSGSISNTMKRKAEEKEDSYSSEKDSGTSSEDQHRDKRLRTTITPEQLEVLYEKYLLDSNPTRKMLDHIALEVGLKKRVVQVWFQNTRARERKGQFRAIGPPQSHKKCPFCRALFKAKSALESHISSRHWHEAKQAGFSLPPSPLVTQEDEAESPNKCHNFEYPQLSTKADTNKYELPATSFTPDKPLQTQLKDFLSPCSIKFENSHDCERLIINSADVTSDQNKADFDETSSVNTAVSDATTGDEVHNDNESVSGSGVEKLAEGKMNSSQSLGGYDEQFLFNRVSPSLSFSGKENEQHYIMQDEQDDNADQSEASSLADPSSPSPFGGGSTIKTGKTGGEKLGNKRFRTQMSNQQVKVLKACFSDYRTPTMQECEMLGNEIGLAKRVVQVWFQNARAKEKKFKINIGKPFTISQNSPDGPRPECTLCGAKYSARFSIRDHIFSKLHIAKVQETLGQQTDREKDFLTPTTVRQLMVQQELDRLKKATDILGMAAQQQGVSEKNVVHDHNGLTGCPGISGLSSVQLPGMNGPSSLPVLPPNTPCLTSTGTGILGFPSPAAPSTARPLSSTPTKMVLQTTSHPSSVPPSLLTNHLIEERGKESEMEKKCDTSQKVKEQEADIKQLKIKKQMKSSLRLLAMGKGGTEVPVDTAQLQVLQNAVATDAGSFLGGQFLPYFLPGLASCLSGQLPGAMQGGYLPSLCGMESLFPYGPIVPQAIPGLSPTAILQYQRSFQDSLQRQQQKQQQQRQKEQEQQVQKPPMTKPSSMQKDTFRGSNKQDKSCPMESTKEEPQSHTKIQDVPDTFIIPSVMHELTCRKCQLTFFDEESVRRHQKCFCYFGQPFPVLQDAMLHEVVSKYDCLACSVSLSGNEALSQHLQLRSHKEKTIKQAMRNAKEHARLLPHSVCSPNLNATSTSHSSAPSNNTYLHLSHSKPWSSVPFQASTGKAASAFSPTISLPSTVTSTLCSTSGGQTLIATGSCSDESDGELNQKLGDLDSLLEVKTKQASVLNDGFSSIQMDLFSV